MNFLVLNYLNRKCRVMMFPMNGVVNRSILHSNASKCVKVKAAYAKFNCDAKENIMIVQNTHIFKTYRMKCLSELTMHQAQELKVEKNMLLNTRLFHSL